MLVTWVRAGPEKKLEQVPTLMVQSFDRTEKNQSFYHQATLDSRINLGYPDRFRADLRRVCEEISNNKKDNYLGPVNQISKIMNSTAGDIVSGVLGVEAEFNFKDATGPSVLLLPKPLFSAKKKASALVEVKTRQQETEESSRIIIYLNEASIAFEGDHDVDFLKEDF